MEVGYLTLFICRKARGYSPFTLDQNRGQSTRNDNKYRNIRSVSRQQRKNINWEILIIESFYVYKELN